MGVLMGLRSSPDETRTTDPSFLSMKYQPVGLEALLFFLESLNFRYISNSEA